MDDSRAYVLHIAFDNTRRLKRNVYYFRYKDQLFKLIQNNPKKHSDVLLTIINTPSGSEEDKAYSLASEFLSALSWEIGSQVSVRHGGGYSTTYNISLRSTKCFFFDIPKLSTSLSPYNGYTIDRIANVITEEQKTALSLFRDAYASNHLYLSFLLYWQVLETTGKRGKDVVNRLYSINSRTLNFDVTLNQLELGSKSLGKYLLDDCRNAIAHIKRDDVKKTSIRLDSAADNRRILLSTKIIQNLARYFIRTTMGLSEPLYLVRCEGTSYPLYADEEFVNSQPCRMAYS